MNLRLYISSLRNLLKNGECQKFVLGNSGADYDSVIGSLLYAFYMTTSFKVLYLPLIDCKQSELCLRFQIATVFDALSINPNNLLYTDMVLNLYTNPNHTFILYDHNFRPQIAPAKIEEIIDHHAFDPSKIACNHIISHCGSALTLLYYLYYPELLQKYQNSQLFKKYQVYSQNRSKAEKTHLLEDSQVINQLFYNGILIDSYGLSPNQTQVWNQYDKHAIETLRQKIKPKFQFDDLGAAKFNEDQNLKLSFQQQQIKDYKCIKYGDIVIHYSTILLNIDLFVSRYWKDISQKLTQQRIQKNQVHAFMFSFPATNSKEDILSGNFKKYILYYCPDKEIVSRIENILNQLKFKKQKQIDGWNVWSDPTGKISRKIFDKQLKARL